MFTQLKPLICFLVLLLSLATLQGCGGCGFDCGDTNIGARPTSIGFSGSPSSDLRSVTLAVDTITFRRTNADNVEVSRFTIDDLNVDDAETFQIDLLNYRGRNQLLVIEDFDFDVGTYSSIALTVLDNDVNNSYVEESGGDRKPLNVTGTTLTVDGMTVNRRQQTITVKFSLPQALQYISSSDSYQLTTNGIRVVDNEDSASITGRVDSSLFNSVAPCNAKDDWREGNSFYLYSGTNLNASLLADVYTNNSTTPAPTNAIRPFDLVVVTQDDDTGDWEYSLGFLPSGDYTLAFTCNAVTDDSVEYDGFAIPLPTNQLYELSLDDGERIECNVEDGATCQ